MCSFQFKQFTIQQKYAAAKVGTDGVLLGAWTSMDHKPKRILDIGTGTGLIALMMAQRCHAATITAIEKDIEAYKECSFNLKNSPWADRLLAIHHDFLTYEPHVWFDLIITNPPFYTAQFLAPNQQRNQARNESHLPFQDLLHKSANYLSDKGILSIIVPYAEEENLCAIAATAKLFPTRICHVKGNPTANFKRSMIEFSKQRQPVVHETLTIEKERHQYTEDYINLTKEFYLKM